MAYTLGISKTIGASSVTPTPVLSSDAAKQKEAVLENRNIPGATESLDRTGQSKTPTANFISQDSQEINPEKTPQQNLRSQLVQASARLIDKQQTSLERIKHNLPNLEELERERLEKERTERAAKEPAKKEEKKTEELEVAEKKSEPAFYRAVESYQKQREPKFDLASGGATREQKGEPPVNVVA